MSEEHHDRDVDDVDREIRIEKLKHEIEEVAGEPFVIGGSSDVPHTLEEAFLSQVLAYEQAEQDNYYNRLIERGMALEPASELDDATIAVRLQQLLQILAEMHCYVHDTDHLNDRELYCWLREDALREQTVDAATLAGAWHTSPIGAGSSEDLQVFLKYYATDDQRRKWVKDFPDETLPPRQPLPYNRDRSLPRAEYE